MKAYKIEIIQVVRRGETIPQNASRFVWWICDLADWTKTINVGDTVVEVTHRTGLFHHQVGLHSAMGELLAIEQSASEGPVYKIRDIDGIEQRWTNCKMVLVEAKAR